ncbi:MAG: hypothetical protein QOE82_2862, partial [Thermoanaerobaculia bacterium]|nr:hypothetical protein [Thermoanaerobaculia bacterium]
MFRTFFLAAVALAIAGGAAAQMTLPVDAVTNDLVAKYGDTQRERATRGVKQIASFWRAEDGEAAAFADFAKTNFAGDQKTLDALFDRMEFAFEQLDGHMLEIGRELRRQSDLDIGPIYPFDEIMAGYDASAHLNDDLFANKLAFAVLLNFPLTTLEQRLTDGNSWSRRQWAEARLAQRFSRRVPAEVNQAISKAGADAAQFVATYNIWMHHLVDDSGARLFPPKMRLLEHWNLRDEIKAEYSEGKAGLAKQRTIQRVMERIVDQSIPNDVVDNPNVDWNPVTNAVKPSAAKDSDNYTPQAPIRESNARYATILKVFRASKLADPYSPTAPT